MRILIRHRSRAPLLSEPVLDPVQMNEAEEGWRRRKDTRMGALCLLVAALLGASGTGDAAVVQPGLWSARTHSSLPVSRKGGLMRRLMNMRGGSTAHAPHTETVVPEAGGRNKTAEREAELQWLFNQVACYQTRLEVAADTLSSFRVGIGEAIFDPEAARPELEVAMSTVEEPLQCRYYFEVEDGCKLVAPCKCRGTQKWVWFSELNRQRRREPVKWRACSTCNAPIDFSKYHKYGSVLAKAASWPLDHRIACRFLIATMGALAGVLLLYPLQAAVIKVLATPFFWAYYTLWSRVVYGPLPLKLVIVQFIARYIWTGFLAAEVQVREVLTELESTWLERSLPVTHHPHKTTEPQEAEPQ